MARECGSDFRLLEEVININEDQRHRLLRRSAKRSGTLRGKRLAVLGLAFKGAKSAPTIPPPSAGPHGRDPASGVSYASSVYEAAQGADALPLLTDWAEFAALDLDRIRAVLGYPIVVDGRNLYDPEVMAAHGFLVLNENLMKCAFYAAF